MRGGHSMGIYVFLHDGGLGKGGLLCGLSRG